MVDDIELILFDLDNVLYHYDRRRRVDRLSEITGLPADDIYAAIWDSGLEHLGDSGALGPQAYLQASATASVIRSAGGVAGGASRCGRAR